MLNSRSYNVMKESQCQDMNEGRPTNLWTFCTVLKPYDLSNSNVYRFFLYYLRINVENFAPIAQRLWFVANF